ncbi:NAD(P)H-dependent oxidoreductase [Desulfobacterales bacterium HSG2]|nr:NAD(P)H-dependent oxidoreductase [Desulfobacterales bacterium HSG2]
MNLSVILAHPSKTSFNNAIAEASVSELRKNDHDIIFHDLYDEKFDPILPKEEIPKDASLPPEIGKHCKELSAADGIIIIHPNWWGQPPAILKGWIDRVFRPGVAYEFSEGDKGEGVPVGLLKAKAAIVFNTSNTPSERELEVFGDPLEALWKNCIFDLCGVTSFYRRMFSMIVTSTPEQRMEWLREVREVMNRYFPRAEQPRMNQ